MVGDAAKQVGDVGLRVELVELGAFDQGVHGRGAPATGIGASKEIVLAADGDAAQRALSGIVVEGETTIVEAAAERGPSRSHVAEGGGELGPAREPRQSLVRPGGECGGDRLGALLAFSSPMVRRHTLDGVLYPVELTDAVQSLFCDGRAG